MSELLTGISNITGIDWKALVAEDPTAFNSILNAVSNIRSEEAKKAREKEPAKFSRTQDKSVYPDFGDW